MNNPKLEDSVETITRLIKAIIPLIVLAGGITLILVGTFSGTIEIEKRRVLITTGESLIVGGAFATDVRHND